MKKVLFSIALGALLTSCAGVKSPIMGAAYTSVKDGLLVTGNSGSSKVGVAEAVGYVGLIALGDASIQAAAKSAGITKIHHVDYESSSILGIINNYKIVVYGE
jgi:hypothetical protein